MTQAEAKNPQIESFMEVHKPITAVCIFFKILNEHIIHI